MKSLDEIVFEHRNKEYGGYHLRSSYKRHVTISYSIVLGLFVLISAVLLLSKIFPSFSRDKKFKFSNQKTVQYDHDLLPVLSDLSFIPAVRPSFEDMPAKAENLANHAKRTSAPDKTPIHELKPVVPAPDSTLAKLAEDLLRRHNTNVLNARSQKPDSLTIVLDTAPRFPGGYAAIQSFFLKNQHYPEGALQRGIQGSAVISFLVSREGTVEKPRVVDGIDPELDWEAIRLVSIMPKWQPAYYKGKPIACMMMMPVDFYIK